MFDKHKGSKQGDGSSRDDAPSADAGAGGAAPTSVPSEAATIGPGISITGDITGSENLAIEGTVKGRVELGEHEVTVGKTGRLNADIVARVVRVDGKVAGDIAGKERVLVSRSGNVEGNIVAPRLILEDGAMFKGTVDMTPPAEEPADAKPAGAAAPAEPVKSSPGSTAKSAAKPVAVDGGRKEAGFATKGG